MQPRLGVRWTVGDVSLRGFAALRCSIQGAWRLFGARAAYAVCVNGIDVAEAAWRVGALPCPVAWHESRSHGIPPWLEAHLGAGMAEGVAWKFAPPRLFPACHELALDNDCILWRMPAGMATWLAAPDACLLAEDVAPAFGQFAALCGAAPRNTGIRGLPPGFDLEGAVRAVLAVRPIRLESELDEQGLQVAALSRAGAPLVVTTREVAICSPFPPHGVDLGECGAHFVGLNVHRPRPYCDATAIATLAAHWDRHRAEVARLVAADR